MAGHKPDPEPPIFPSVKKWLQKERAIPTPPRATQVLYENYFISFSQLYFEAVLLSLL